VQRANLLPGIATVAAFILSGCYPSYLTSRPKAEIIVTDESGAPLAGATVTLATMEWHGIVGQNRFEKFSTDSKGRVVFDSQHDWAMQVLLPDGDVGYSWSLCFSKPGFEAIPLLFMNFDQPIKVSMYSSAVASECYWEGLSASPRVKEREARWIEVGVGEWVPNLGIAVIMDEAIRGAMEASAREQGIKLRSWSEYRFQFQELGSHDQGRRLLVHAVCRAPESFNLNESFYSEPDDSACFFDTIYTTPTYTNQPPAAFGPLKITSGKS